MRLLYRSFAFASLALCAASAAVAATCSAAVRAIDRFIVALLAIVPAESPRFAMAGVSPQLDMRGHQLDPALRQSMRHESMSARVGAPRGI